MALKSKKQVKQQTLYLGIFLSIALIAVFIFGATYGNYIKTQVALPSDDPSPEGACVWTVTTLSDTEDGPPQTEQVCQIMTGTKCNERNDEQLPPGAPLVQTSHFPGHTCEEHGIPTPEPIPMKVPLIPIPDPNFNVIGENQVASIAPEPSDTPEASFSNFFNLFY